jgi:hypothetical protein
LLHGECHLPLSQPHSIGDSFGYGDRVYLSYQLNDGDEISIASPIFICTSKP